MTCPNDTFTDELNETTPRKSAETNFHNSNEMMIKTEPKWEGEGERKSQPHIGAKKYVHIDNERVATKE